MLGSSPYECAIMDRMGLVQSTSVVVFRGMDMSGDWKAMTRASRPASGGGGGGGGGVAEWSE